MPATPDKNEPDKSKPVSSAQPDNPQSGKPEPATGGPAPSAAGSGQPEDGTAPAEQAVAGQGSIVEAIPGTAPALGTDAAPLPQIALVLKAIDQKELREFHAEYSSSTAVQRSYRPQGFFGLSPATLARLPAGAFIEVNTDDEFWRQYDVSVYGPTRGDYDALGLRSAAVQLDYGAADRRRRVTRTLEFLGATDTGTPKAFSAPMIPNIYHYDATITYVFNESWTGDPRPRTISLPATTLRTVYVVPQQDFRFTVVNASFTAPPDWTEMSQIHAQLVCRSLSTTQSESFTRHLVIHEGWVPSLLPPAAGTVADLPWRIRFKDPQAAIEITCRLTYITRKGQRHDADPIVTGNPNLVFPPRL